MSMMGDMKKLASGKAASKPKGKTVTKKSKSKNGVKKNGGK